MSNERQSKLKILLVWPNKDGFGFKPISLALLSAIAKKKGCEVKLFDATSIDFGHVINAKSVEEAKLTKPVDMSAYNMVKRKVSLRAEFAKVFNEFDPDCVAFTVLSDEYIIADKITKIARDLKKDVKIIWGGKYPTLEPEETLTVHGVDYVCVNEGLDAWGEFIDALSSSGDTTKIQNIWTKQGGKIISNETRPVRDDLDGLPHGDWSIYDDRHFYKPYDGKVVRGGDHMINWGCPYKCSYCINQFNHDTYDNNYSMRRYGVKRIVDELEIMKDTYNLEFFRFHDEDFLMRPIQNLEELSEEYQKRVNLPFSIETNPKSVTERRAQLLKNMNCVSASLAIETGDMKLRKELLDRPDTREDVVSAFKIMRNNGIRTCAFNLLAIPFETRETYWETVKVNREAEGQYPFIHFFYPFHGTPLRDVAIKEGLWDPDGVDKNNVYERDLPALRFKNLTEDELVQMRKAFVLYVKLPEAYHGFIKRSETPDKTGTLLRGKLLDIYDNTVWDNEGWYKDDGRTEEYLLSLSDVLEGNTSQIDAPTSDRCSSTIDQFVAKNPQYDSTC